MPAAKVKILREGFFRWTEKYSACEASGTVALIEDGGKKIIVDAGGSGEEAELLAALKEAGISADEIDVAVATHFHPDHVGCLHLFSNAEFVTGGARWRGSSYRFWEDGALPLTDDVYVLKTPGHTDDCCSVISSTDMGVVAVVGDLWWSPEDAGLMMVADREKLAASRKVILDLADFIIPGHAGRASAEKFMQ